MRKQEIIKLLESSEFSDVYDHADVIRRENVGDEIRIRAIIEYSSYCKRKCKYCGLNADNRALQRYRLSIEDIISLSAQAKAVGYKTVVLQGGEDDYYSASRMGEAVKEISKMGMAVTLSMGELDYQSLKYLRDCGANRYLLKHETSSEKIYSYLHPDAKLNDRIECLRNIKSLGYQTGSGFMIGLPEQTPEVIAEDILLLKELECDMAGIGPFIPHPQTLLKDMPHGSIELTKRAVAITRMLLPKANLPATTSLGVLEDGKNRSVFNCGANVIMRKVTPSKERRLYEIYPSQQPSTDIESERRELENMITLMGRIPD